MLLIICVSLVFTTGCCTHVRSFVTKTVSVGEDVTLTCSRNSDSGGYLFWFRLVAGNLPEVLGATYSFNHYAVNETPHITSKQGPGTFILHIKQAKLSDTAFYYCDEITELRTMFLNITFLTVKGPEPDITAVIQDVPSDPVRPGDPVTLQCSVLSEKKSFPQQQHRVFWFRAASNESHPSLLYVHGNDSGKCEMSSESRSLQKCVYSFSQSVASSDAGTYYCAVATCGQILFGNGTKVEIQAANVSAGDSRRVDTVLFLLCAALALSLVAVALLIYTIKKKKYECFSAAAADHINATVTSDVQQRQTTEEDSLVYSAPNFTRKKAGRSVRKAAKVVEGESIYADVRVLGDE